MSEKPPPSNRTFGFVFTAFFALLSFLLRRKHPDLVPYAGALSGVFLLAALLAPAVLAPLNRAWMGLAELMHRVTSPIVLGALFFIVFTPAALVMKLIKRDTMARRFDATLASYWNVRNPPGPPPASLRDQF